MRQISLILLLLITSCHLDTSASKDPDDASLSKDSITERTHSSTPEKLEDSEYDNLSDSDDFEADAAHQWNANKKLDTLLKHYGNNIPEYYAGAFIDETGNLVINLKGDLAKSKSEIISIIGKEQVLFEKKPYSYNELLDIMDYLNAFASKPENKPYTKNLSSWSLMDRENYVNVCFIKMTQEAKEEFKKNILNSDAIRFQECGKIIEE